MENEDFERDFKALEYRFIQRFKKKPSLEGILLLIGYQESPVVKNSQSKEEKLDLINLGVLVALENQGFFRRRTGENGWPEFDPTDMQASEEKEVIIRRGILEYFRKSGL